MTLPQQVVLYKATKSKPWTIYDSAYTEDQVADVQANCRINHHGALPLTKLAETHGGKLKV